MLAKIKYLTAITATALMLPSITFADSNFSYDFFEVGMSSTSNDSDSYSSIDINGSMLITNDHYITAHLQTDISGSVTANQIGVGVGAFKASSDVLDYYSRAGVMHENAYGGSEQTLNVGFGARYQLNDNIEIKGGIDFLFSTGEDSSGLGTNITALYKLNEKFKVGLSAGSNGENGQLRLFTQIDMP